MAKIINTGAPLSVDATVTGHAASNSTDTHPSDHPRPASGGGGK